MSYLAYVLDEESRSKLLNRFGGTVHDKIVAHHVTAKFPVPSDTKSPMTEHVITVIGYACNNKVEAAVVSVDDNPVRDDGKLFHITMSVNSNGGKPVMSNDLIAKGDNALPVDMHEFKIKGRLEVVH